MTILTAACPVTLRAAGDALALQLGTENGWMAQEWTEAFAPLRVDAEGNFWHVLSLPVVPAFVMDNYATMSQVPGLTIWLAPGPEDDPLAEPVPVPTALTHPDDILVVIGMPGVAALAAMGLLPREAEE